MKPPPAALVIACLVAACVVAGCSSDDGPGSSGPPSQVVATTSPLAGGLQRVTYGGATVDVPDDWKPTACGQGDLTQVGPSGTGPCSGGVGVAFYRSATFDPADGPGVISRSPSVSDSLWGGYDYGGDWAVYVQTPRRDLTRQILASVG